MAKKQGEINAIHLSNVRGNAEKGLATSQYQLGAILASGSLAPKNLTEAFEWYSCAAKQGHIEAKWNVGLMLLNGEGVNRDVKRGFKLIQLAADEGSYSACLFVADCYRLGHYGMNVDMAKSEEWRLKANDFAEINTDRIGKPLLEV